MAARADLFYTVNFPLGFKYLALYPSTPDGNPAAPELRQRIRASLQERLRSGDIDDPTAVIDGGDAGIRTLLAAVQPPPGPKRPQPAAAGTSAAATAAAAAKKKAAPSPAAPAAAHTPAAPSSTKRAREEDAHADHDDAAESSAAADTKKKKQKKQKLEPVAEAEETLDPEPTEAAGDDGADDFFATEPVLPKRRVKEYRVNDGGHHPEQTSRRGWLKQQRYGVCTPPPREAAARTHSQHPENGARTLVCAGRTAPCWRRRAASSSGSGKTFCAAATYPRTASRCWPGVLSTLPKRRCTNGLTTDAVYIVCTSYCKREDGITWAPRGGWRAGSLGRLAVDGERAKGLVDGHHLEAVDVDARRQRRDIVDPVTPPRQSERMSARANA